MELVGLLGAAERLFGRGTPLRPRWLLQVRTASAPRGKPVERPSAGAVTAVVGAAGPSASMQHVAAFVEKNLGTLHRLADLRDVSDRRGAVHDVRVAARRLRAFVEAFPSSFSPEDARRARRLLRRTRRRQGRRRDADVTTAALLERASAASSDAVAAALEHVAEREVRRLAKLSRTRTRVIATADLAWLAPTLRGALDLLAEREASPSTTFGVLAWTALEPRIEPLSAALAAVDAEPTPESLHGVRVRLKQLRYAVELVEPALGPRFEDLHSSLKGLQSLLGDYQDAIVLGAVLGEHRARLEARGRSALARSLESSLVQLDDERSALFERFRSERDAIDGDRLRRSARSALAIPWRTT